MKKSLVTVFLFVVLTCSVFAEGEFPIGGRTCPQNQTCLVEQTNQKPENQTIFELVKSYVKKIFG